MQLSTITHIKKELAAFLILGAIAGSVAEAQSGWGTGGNNEFMPLPPRENGILIATGANSNNHAESDWNCLDVGIGGTGLRAIIPNFDSHNDKQVAEMLYLLKALLPATVLESTGQIGQWVADGTIRGLEFSMFPLNPVEGATSYLPVLGRVHGEDDLGQFGTLGTIYCFTEAQYQQRIDRLTDLMDGMPPSQHEIWLGPTMHSGSPGLRGMQITGNDNDFYGDLKSNSEFLLGGLDNRVHQMIRYRGNAFVNGGGNTFGGMVEEAAEALSLPNHEVSWYRQTAIANGTFFDHGLVIDSDVDGSPIAADGTPLSGVVYARGLIRVVGDGLQGNLTLITERRIVFSGGDARLSPAADGLLACSVGRGPMSGVVLAGNGNELKGAIFDSGTGFVLRGSFNHLAGHVGARRVEIAGNHNTLSDGTHPPQ